MRHSKHNGGFTLIELLVTIAVGSLVTIAAMSLMLLGVRINRRSVDNVIRQNDTRTVLMALEKAATEGGITKLVNEPDSWVIYGKPDGITETPLFSYVSDDGMGSDEAAGGVIYAAGRPILENVIASFITINDNAVLTFSVETEDGSYNTSVYCRTMAKKKQENLAQEKLPEPEDEQIQVSDMPARMEFLKTLTSQYRLIGGDANPGLVLDQDGHSTGRYYSWWYINDNYNEFWNAETPWCACFVSWGLHEIADEWIRSIPEMGHRVECEEFWNCDNTGSCYHYYHWFASVDRFAESMQEESENPANDFRWEKSAYYHGDYDPVPGDIIFIDWEGDRDPDHVAVLLSKVTEDGVDYAYTIEGNSAGIVAVRRYALDGRFILAYGVLDWKETRVPGDGE